MHCFALLGPNSVANAVVVIKPVTTKRHSQTVALTLKNTYQIGFICCQKTPNRTLLLILSSDIAMSLGGRFSSDTFESYLEKKQINIQPQVNEQPEMDVDKLNRESHEEKRQQEVERRNKMADAWRMRERQKKG